MKKLKFGALLVFLLVAVVVWKNYPKLNLIAGFAAKNTASNHFIAKRSIASIQENDNNVPLIKLARVAAVTDAAVTSSVFGLMARKSVYREGLGCVLVNDDYDTTQTLLKPQRNTLPKNLPFPYGNAPNIDTVFAAVDYDLLTKAVTNAFDTPKVQKTRTLLVVYKNQIIAEKYADGFSATTPVLGWSMTKSVLATLYGILEYQQQLDVNYQPFKNIKINQEQDRLKQSITLNHLLRMQSGLAWEEDYTKISDVTKMLFLDADMTAAQTDKTSIAPPIEIWNYSSGTSNALSGILRKHFTNDQDYLNFPYQQLIDRIGMHSMLLETDMDGNFVGSSYGWATTRDWAKFGILYANKGVWNGERIFDENWVAYVSKPTKHSDGVYGAHFWLNAGGKFPDVPRDMYSANGFQGQYVFVIPSKDLVVVRTGLAEHPEFDVNTFLKEICAAIKD